MLKAMTTKIAWEVMDKVVRPRAKELDVMGKYDGTIYSTEDWDDGVALETQRGIIHVKGTGEIIDEKNILGYHKYWDYEQQ
jgi:hypothetical protein